MTASPEFRTDGARTCEIRPEPISDQTIETFQAALGADVSAWSQAGIEALVSKVAGFYLEAYEGQVDEIRLRHAQRQAGVWQAYATGSGIDEIAREHGIREFAVLAEKSRVTDRLAKRNKEFYSGRIFEELVAEMIEDGFRDVPGMSAPATAPFSAEPVAVEAEPVKPQHPAVELYLRIFGQNDQPAPSPEGCMVKIRAAMHLYKVAFGSPHVSEAQRKLTQRLLTVVDAYVKGVAEADILDQLPDVTDVQAWLSMFSDRARTLYDEENERLAQAGGPKAGVATAAVQPAGAEVSPGIAPEKRTARKMGRTGIAGAQGQPGSADDGRHPGEQPPAGGVRRSVGATPAKTGALLRKVIKQAPEDGDWWRRAACARSDPEIFFPAVGQSTAKAKRICQGCEVRLDCLRYAISNGERAGVWGGLTIRQIHRLRGAS